MYLSVYTAFTPSSSRELHFFLLVVCRRCRENLLKIDEGKKKYHTFQYKQSLAFCLTIIQYHISSWTPFLSFPSHFSVPLLSVSFHIKTCKQMGSSRENFPGTSLGPRSSCFHLTLPTDNREQNLCLHRSCQVHFKPSKVTSPSFAQCFINQQVLPFLFFSLFCPFTLRDFYLIVSGDAQ